MGSLKKFLDELETSKLLQANKGAREADERRKG